MHRLPPMCAHAATPTHVCPSTFYWVGTKVRKFSWAIYMLSWNAWGEHFHFPTTFIAWKRRKPGGISHPLLSRSPTNSAVSLRRAGIKLPSFPTVHNLSKLKPRQCIIYWVGPTINLSELMPQIWHWWMWLISWLDEFHHAVKRPS